LFALLLLAVPIGIALSSAAAAFIIGDPLLETTVIFRQFFSFIARYSLTAIPLFIFAGFLMEKTGLIKQLFGFADALVGHLRAASASPPSSPACCSARSPARAWRWRPPCR
jgi:TRAP-type mannitol/chloroaromatic compound transport system permease large subunit